MAFTRGAAEGAAVKASKQKEGTRLKRRQPHED